MNSIKSSTRALAAYFILFSLFSADQVNAQEFKRFDEINAQGTAYNIFAKEGEATIQIIVLGAGSGIYEIGVDTELDQLLALTGNANLPSNIGDNTTVTVRLFRKEGGERQLIYESPIEDTLNEPAQYPAFQDGDVLIIETITRERKDIQFWSSLLRVIANAASLYLLFDRLTE